MTEQQLTIGLTGNTFLTQSVSRFENPRFQAAVQLLRDCDVTLCNLECTIPDPDDPPAFVAGTGWAATYLAGAPAMLDDIRYLGIDGVCAANNHVSDFGDAGILSTIRHLRSARLPFAGIGESLSAASEAAYLDTPSGHRVAFLAACDWGTRGRMGLNFPWPAGYLASDEAPPFRSRPGVNLLRYDAESVVTREQLAALREISQALGWERDKTLRRIGFWRSHPLVGMTSNLGVEEDSDDRFHFLGRRFVVGPEAGHRTYACEEDVERILRQVREARRQADLVVLALHDQSHGERINDYIADFAHRVIDAGADVYINNGGTQKGVELYRGKVIIYGQPGLVLQSDGVGHLPSSSMSRFRLPSTSTAGEFLEVREEKSQKALREVGGPGRALGGAGATIVHVCVFDSQLRLQEVRIHPLQQLGGDLMTFDTEIPRFRRGLPMTLDADSPLTASVLAYSAELCSAVGTELEVRDGVGIVSAG